MCRTGAVLALVTGVAALTACAGPNVPPGPASPVPPSPVPSEQLVATATQTRPQIAAGGLFQVTVKSTGSTPFVVRSVALASPGYAALPPTPSEASFAPGNVIALDLPYGDAVCQSVVEPLTATLEITDTAGTRSVTVPLVSPYDLMQRIHDEQCQRRALAREITLSLDLAPDGTGALVVTRLDTPDPVRVGGIGGTVLYDVTAAPVTLSPEQDQTGEPLTIAGRTCKAHDFAEAKQPYRFLAYVTVGDAREVAVPVPVTEEQKVLLQQVLTRGCPVLTAS